MSKVSTPSSKEEEENEEDLEQDQQLNKNKHTLSWTDQIESLLSGWADTAAVYKWLHDKSHRKYKRKNKAVIFNIKLELLCLGNAFG